MSFDNELLNSLSKKDLLLKCETLNIQQYKTKNKAELIILIQNKLSNVEETYIDKDNIDILTFTKCDVFTPESISNIMKKLLANHF